MSSSRRQELAAQEILAGDAQFQREVNLARRRNRDGTELSEKENRRHESAVRRAHALVTPSTVRLQDRTTGYFAPGRLDRCFSCAIATVLQIPLDEVPDTNIDSRLYRHKTSRTKVLRDSWNLYVEWCDARGRAMIYHEAINPPPEGRWIGVCPYGRGPFDNHCLVLTDSTVIFNPSTFPHLQLGPPLTGADVRWGISFIRRS